jgi:hypothetical protein
MNPVSRLVRRLTAGLRNAGGFSGAEDTAAIRRQTKDVQARLSRLEDLSSHVQALRKENHELRRQMAHLEKALGTLASRDDLRELGAAMKQLQKLVPREVAAIRRDSRTERRALERIQSQLLAIIRRLEPGHDALPYPYRLTAQRFGALSQSEEDGITLAILHEIGDGDRRFVDIGCSDHGWNTGVLAEERGWSGLMVDSSEQSVAATALRFPRSRVRALTATVTPATIDELLTAHGFAAAVDVLSVDVDGNDYWLWDALSVCRPRLVIMEYNSAFGAERAVVVPYDDANTWAAPAAQEHRYFGASLKAVQRLAIRKGYRLVAIDPDSANAFCLRSDVAPHIPGIEADELFRAQRKYAAAELRGTSNLFATIERERLPLLEVE